AAKRKAAKPAAATASGVDTESVAAATPAPAPPGEPAASKPKKGKKRPAPAAEPAPDAASSSNSVAVNLSPPPPEKKKRKAEVSTGAVSSVKKSKPTQPAAAGVSDGANGNEAAASGSAGSLTVVVKDIEMLDQNTESDEDGSDSDGDNHDGDDDEDDDEDIDDEDIPANDPTAVAAVAAAASGFSDTAEDLSLDAHGLSAATKAALLATGRTALFPIQAACFRHIAAGRDLLGRARTGTGKTLAFVLPIVEAVRRDRTGGAGAAGRPPVALVMAPTRELALQVCREFEVVGGADVSSTCAYGGAGVSSQ
ncbi:hypothetical protein HK405_002321, partial [Cladochytrium tenue]